MQAQRSTTTSRHLPAGSRVALIAPAGPLANDGELQRSIDNTRLMGWEPVPGKHVRARHGYFAGSDDERLADLQWAVGDDSIDGIWCVRGGYGAMRLLPSLDVDAVTRANKPLIGFSDVTALHSLWQRAGVVSYHGPTARAVLSEFSHSGLQHAVQSREPLHFEASGAASVRGGKASGILAGGNLALLAALCGTPWQVNLRDAIVVIEDVGEAMYRLDRMLVQLRLAGAFEGCAGVVFGQFSNCPDGTEDGARTLQELIDETVNALRVPAIAGVPVGHIGDQWTLPLGEMATLDAGACTLTVRHTSFHTGSP